IADPVSDLSLIGKPGPTLPNQNWIGDKPELEGKAVLLFFWAPWSLPCKKFLSPMAGFQKEFEGKLQVVGVLGEDTTEARNAAASCGFPSLIDAGGKLVAGAGVSSIPFVLLVNAKGTVLYAGHPAALNEKNLDVLLEKAE
ncbi:MAG TPA: TlpA disulfide reductase family protein, partial [Verrucomicrobiae bacterium]|nr:TlpA disulfide reductase family protein [Verrucomicrobiae bacterium]